MYNVSISFTTTGDLTVAIVVVVTDFGNGTPTTGSLRWTQFCSLAGGATQFCNWSALSHRSAQYKYSVLQTTSFDAATRGPGVIQNGCRGGVTLMLRYLAIVSFLLTTAAQTQQTIPTPGNVITGDMVSVSKGLLTIVADRTWSADLPKGTKVNFVLTSETKAVSMDQPVVLSEIRNYRWYSSSSKPVAGWPPIFGYLSPSGARPPRHPLSRMYLK
jgi:hypothetical protein